MLHLYEHRSSLAPVAALQTPEEEPLPIDPDLMLDNQLST